MFRSEALNEVLNSILQNKVRTILAGFGVAWGIFILVILLGVGQGFQSGVMGLFDVFAQKSVYVYGGITSLKYGNIREGAEVSFDQKYLNFLSQHFSEIEAISPEMVFPNVLVSHATKSSVYTVTGVTKDYFRIKLLQPKDAGRLFNELDAERKRNVAVIGEGVERALFDKKSAVGELINVGDVFYQVIGILKGDNLFALQEMYSIYIPFESCVANSNSEGRFNSFAVILNSKTNAKTFETDLKNYIAYKSKFDIEDAQALYIANIETQTSNFESLFKGLQLLIWSIGICFLLSGIVGICNIMLIIVKERTPEIGIRVAVGALPTAIINLVMLESVTITMIAGIIGFGLGSGVLYLIDIVIESMTDAPIMDKTSINAPVIVFAFIVLVISGIIAGLFPAIKAAQVSPVDAIRYENRG